MSILSQYIEEGEHQTQDFKFCIDDQKKIARTLCAFANSDGGRLLIGVKDNGKVSGVNPEEEIFMIEEAANRFCFPQVDFRSTILQDDYKLVVEIYVEKSRKAPHRAEDDTGKLKIYLRVGDQTLAANKILERVWAIRMKSLMKKTNFNEIETGILETISTNQPITLSQLYKYTKLPLKEVDNYLVLLINCGVVKWNHSREGFVYSLSAEY